MLAPDVHRPQWHHGWVTSPSYEQYPRPSGPVGPSSWEQPAFVATADPTPPAAGEALEVVPDESDRQLILRPTRTNYRRAVRSWALITLVCGVLAVALLLAGVVTQLTGLVAAAFVIGALSLIGAFETLASVAKGVRARAGSPEDNG